MSILTIRISAKLVNNNFFKKSESTIDEIKKNYLEFDQVSFSLELQQWNQQIHYYFSKIRFLVLDDFVMTSAAFGVDFVVLVVFVCT